MPPEPPTHLHVVPEDAVGEAARHRRQPHVVLRVVEPEQKRLSRIVPAALGALQTGDAGPRHLQPPRGGVDGVQPRLGEGFQQGPEIQPGLKRLLKIKSSGGDPHLHARGEVRPRVAERNIHAHLKKRGSEVSDTAGEMPS
jgi:hypothetical protein